jgi:magnesium chelatase family protein
MIGPRAQVHLLDRGAHEVDALVIQRAEIRARVEAAREVQAARFAALDKAGILVNGDMGPAEVQDFCPLDDEGVNLMRAAVKQMDLSARAYHRVLKMARTIADIAGQETLETQHLAEALQYRPPNLM